MASLTPATQTPGSPGSHTANIKKDKLADIQPNTKHSFITARSTKGVLEFAAYITHVVVP